MPVFGMKLFYQVFDMLPPVGPPAAGIIVIFCYIRSSF